MMNWVFSKARRLSAGGEHAFEYSGRATLHGSVARLAFSRALTVRTESLCATACSPGTTFLAKTAYWWASKQWHSDSGSGKPKPSRNQPGPRAQIETYRTPDCSA